MWRDTGRLCTKYGVSFAKLSHFPRDSLFAARVACLTSAEPELWLPDFVRAVFRANFAEDREIGDAEEIRSILEDLGQPGAELIERAQTPEKSSVYATIRREP